MTLNTAGAVNSEPTGQSVMPAATWRKGIIRAGTDTAPDATTLQDAGGLPDPVMEHEPQVADSSWKGLLLIGLQITDIEHKLPG